jgi:hypothetical protein
MKHDYAMKIFQARSQNCKKRLLASSRQSVRPSVRPSVRTEKLGFHETDFHENLYLNFD